MMKIRARFRPGDEVYILATERQRSGSSNLIKPITISPHGPRVYRAKVHGIMVDGDGAVSYIFKHGTVTARETGTSVELYDLTLDENLVFADEKSAIRRLLTLATDDLAEFRAMINERRGEAEWL